MKTEKIARMVGKTTYHDLKQGFASGTFVGDSDADIKHALGMVRTRLGELHVMVLETKYASTIMHERAIRRAWDRYCRDETIKNGGKRVKESFSTQRVGAALAIRALAGAPVVKADREEWAWLLCVSQSAMSVAIHDCAAWLDDICHAATRTFLEVLGKEVD